MASVASMSVSTACFLPSAANRATSTTLRCGLVGDSLTNSRVFGVIAASMRS